MAFFDKYVSLCAAEGKSPSAVAMSLGFSNATVSSWKKGSIPTYNTLVKLSRHFSVSVEYLLDPTEFSVSVTGLPNPTVITPEYRRDATAAQLRFMVEIGSIIKELNADGCEAAFNSVSALTENPQYQLFPGEINIVDEDE